MADPVRQSTGIPALDELLGGGLVPGTLTVVVGATGIGKTQLGIQYAHAGLAAVLVGLGYLTIAGRGFYDGGSMATFLLLIANSYTNIKKTTRVWTRVQESVGAAERMDSRWTARSTSRTRISFFITETNSASSSGE